MKESFSEWSAAYSCAYQKSDLECAYREAIEGLNRKAPTKEILAAMARWVPSARALAILEATRHKFENNPFTVAAAKNDGGEAMRHLMESLPSHLLDAINVLSLLNPEQAEELFVSMMAETTDLDAVIAKGGCQ